MTARPVNRWRQTDWLLVVLSAAALLACLCYTLAYVFLVPYPGVTLNSGWMVISIDPRDDHPGWSVADRNSLQIGDQVLAIGDLTYEGYWSDRRCIPFDGYGSGDRVPITVQRNGQLQTMPWLMPAISQGNQAWRLVGLLFYLPFWLVGTAVLLLLRPRDQRWRLLAAFNYVTAFWLAAGMVSQSGVANSSLVQHALSWLFVPIYLHLHLLVPTPLLRPRLRTYLLLFLYALAAALAALELFQLLPSSAYALGLLLAIPGSLGLLTWRLFDHSSPAARLAACVMLAGIGLAFGPGIILGLIPKLLDSAAPGATAMNVAMLGIPLLPLAYAYALYKRTLGPLEFRANRLLSLYSFALLYLMAFAVVFLGCQQWIPSSDGFLAFVLVVSTVSAAAAPTLYARFQRLVDRLAYGIRYDPDEIFRAFANRVPAALDRPVLVSLLADEVTPSLLIRESALVLLTNGKADLVYARGVNLAEIPETSQQVQDWLAEAGRYRPPGPEATETPTSTDWVRLAIAVKAHGPAMGVWLLGRRDPDDYYPQPDIALLTALASQVAVALENARLFEAVARGEREWQMTFDSITDWVSLVDLEARIQRTNRVGETFVGVPPAEMLGQTCCQLVHGTTEPISECPLRQMQRTRRREAAEFRIPGAERWLMITTDPLLDEHEQLVGAVHIVRDITTRKHAEEALRQHTVQLEALRQIGLELTAQLDLEALLGSVLARAVELLGATGGLVYLYDPTLKRLTAMTSLNLGRDYRGLMLDAGEGAAGQVLLTGEPLVIDDQQAWTGKSPQVAEADARSVLVVPLKWQDQVIGVLAIVDHDRAAAFDQSDQQFLVSFAIQAAIAIRNARAVAAEEYQRRQAEALVQATAALASTLELEPLLENVLAAAVQAISAAEKGSILLLDEATGILHIRAVTGYGDPRIRMIRFPQEAGYSAQAVREGRPRLIPDARAGPICYEGEIEEVRAVQSAVVAPLRYRDQVIGVISLDNVTTRGAFTADDLRLLAAFADQAAVAVENARLLDQARQRLQSLTNLSRASQIVTSSLHVDEVLQQIVTLAGSVVHSDYTSVVLVDAEGQPELGAEDFRGVPPIARRIRGTGVTRQVLDRGQPLVADTISADGMISPPFPGSDGEVLLANPAIVVAGIRSFAAVPIQVQEKRLGVLFVHSCATGAFHGQLPLLVTFANQIAVAIENARLFAAERRARQLSDILSEVVRELNAAPDLDAALALVLSYMERVIAFDSGSVLLLEGGQMNVAAVRGFANPERVRQVQFDLEVALLNREVVETRRPLIQGAVADDPRWVQPTPASGLSPHLAQVHSWMGIPLLIQDRVIGMLTADKAEPDFYRRQDAELALVFAGHAAVVIEKAHLYQTEQQRASEALALSAIAQALNASTGLAAVYQTTERELRRVVDFDRLTLTLCSADRQYFTVFALADQAAMPLGSGATMPVAASAATEDVLAGRPHLTPDLTAELDYPAERLLYDAGLRSRLNLPLLLGQTVIGALNLASCQPHAFGPQQLPLLSQVTAAVTAAVQNAQLFDETRRRAAHLAALNAVITAAVAAPNLVELLAAALEHTLRALGLEMGSIWMADRHALRGITPEAHTTIIEAIQANGLELSGAVAVADWQEPISAPHAVLASLMARYGIRATLAMPLLTGGHHVGGLTLVAASPRPWDTEEVVLAEAVGQQLGVAAERLRLLEQTREQAQQVQQIMDTVPEGVLFLDAQARILQANPAALEYLGLLTAVERDQPGVGDQLTDLGGWPMPALLEPPPPGVPYHEITRAGMPPLVFEVQARPLATGATTRSWVLLIRDVSAAREIQGRVQQQERLAAVGQLAAGIAHDFNNILTGMIGLAQLVQIRQELSPATREDLDRIVREGHRAAHLIRQILDFSRTSSRASQLLDLVPLLKEIVKFLERTIPEHIRLDLEIDPGEHQVYADLTQIQQVVTNLAVNARDAMPHGGDLVIRLTRLVLQPGDHPPCADLAPGEWVVLSIRDTGTGIPPEIMARIFEPFFTTKEVGQGSGLGLAQVYGIVKQHRGYIDVVSQVGAGTIFFIYLPAAPTGAMIASEAPQEPVPPGQGELILLAEDDPTVREVVQAGLQQLGYRVLAAANGQEARQVYEQRPDEIALVLTDLLMPVMDGLALCESLRALDPAVKVVMITGHPLGDGEQLLVQGIAGWIQKPPDQAQLAQVLRRVLTQ